MTSRRPGIFQIGRVVERGGVTRIYGWGVQLCEARCWCHQLPAAPHRLTILEDQPEGRLGLRTTNPDCQCCEPWTADELAAVASDLASIEKLSTLDGETA